MSSPRTAAARRGPLPQPLLALAAVAALLALAVLLVAPAPPARALAGTSTGTGHLWRGDGVSWLGTYRLDDGRQAFCLEVGKKSPVGNRYDTATGDAVVGVSSEDHARLAYIARTWGGTKDPDTAAAGQLAVWTITGLGGHSQRYYAGRANDHWPIVLQRANDMLAEATARASRSVDATLTVSLADDGTGSVRADLVADLVTGGPTTLPGRHVGTVTLQGAEFTDGSGGSRRVKNGETVRVRATGPGAELSVRARVRFDGLPYGRVATVGSSAAGSQMILFTGGVSAAAAGSASATAVSPLPFAPRVVTQASDTIAEAGTVVTDRLTLDVARGDGLLDEWGRYRADGQLRPVPVTVRSRLLGPFFEPLVEADAAPADAPVVCEVETVVTDGPGTVTTPGCELPSTGWFTWVESIDPGDTSPSQGGERLRPWTSRFGTAPETTFAPFTPIVSTVAAGGATEVGPGACVTDALTVARLNALVGEDGVEVTSTLVGPFADQPEEGEDLTDLLEVPGLVAGEVVTTVHADGEVQTPCVRVDRPGHYVFVLSSEGSAELDDGSRIVPAFVDHRAHAAESFLVPEPEPGPESPEPEPADEPGPEQPSPSATPPALAFTGGDAGATGQLALGVVLAGALLLVGLRVAHLVRRRSR